MGSSCIGIFAGVPYEFFIHGKTAEAHWELLHLCEPNVRRHSMPMSQLQYNSSDANAAGLWQETLVGGLNYTQSYIVELEGSGVNAVLN